MALGRLQTCLGLAPRISALRLTCQVPHFSRFIGVTHAQERQINEVPITEDKDNFGELDRTKYYVEEEIKPNPNPALPITVISGFLGSGKTTLIKHILRESGEKRLGVLVNDMSSLDVDGKLIKGYLADPEKDIVMMSDGCICCTIGGNLEEKVDELAMNQNLDCLIVEGSGVALPINVAANLFDAAPEDGGLVKLDAMVTVVDTHRFFNDVMCAASLADKGIVQKEHDDRSVGDILVEQVEFADILILNKLDLVNESEKERVRSAVEEMNPSAQVIEATNCSVPIEAILNTGLFDPVAAMESPGWLQKIKEDQEAAAREDGGSHQKPEAKHKGISSFVYRARRPFHPDRLLNDALSVKWKGVLRSKGFFWLATRHDQMGIWQSAGASWGCHPGMDWMAAIPERELPEGIDKSKWHKKWGDRCTELVWIGEDMDPDEIKSMLDRCLLTAEEMGEGPGQWSLIPDNLPPWPVDEWKWD